MDLREPLEYWLEAIFGLSRGCPDEHDAVDEYADLDEPQETPKDWKPSMGDAGLLHALVGEISGHS
eukprot:4163305-Pyramimonas_sp.AAC.1